MVALVFFAIGLCFLVLAVWLIRINRWPRVQVRVVKRWEEITGHNDDGAVGWQHADIEYWYLSRKYSVRWKTDLQDQRLMASAIRMVVNPYRPEAPQLPADWHISAVFAFIAILAFSGFVYRLIK
jgi:hypothetical protein